MTALATASRHALAEWARIASDELDEILGRVTRADARLVLERESDLWWTVMDTANGVVMMRAGREVCVRFMETFVRRTAGAELDRASVEHSWRVAFEAEGALSEREGGAAGGRRTSTQGSPSRSENVFPIRLHEQIDETGAA